MNDAASKNSPLRLAIVSPVYEDAASAARLVSELASRFRGSQTRLHVLLVDDGSSTPLAEDLRLEAVGPDCIVDILRLRRNVGHQRAIALGTAYVHEKVPCDAMLVMDADGEDRPEDAMRLVGRFREGQGRRIVFAERTRRSETVLFLVLYRLYQWLHWMLTGIRVRVGNFSIVPARCLSTLVVLPELWNHYAAAIFHSRLPFELLPTERGLRYSGRSKMDYLSLIMHGLHAISVFSDMVAVRLLVVVFGLAVACAGVLVGTILSQCYGPARAPEWMGYGWWALLVLLVLTLGCFSLVLSLMSQRNSLDFIPIRDYGYFVEGTTRVTPAYV